MAEKRQEGINIAPISRDGQTAEKRVPPPISLAVNRWKILVPQRCLSQSHRKVCLQRWTAWAGVGVSAVVEAAVFSSKGVPPR